MAERVHCQMMMSWDLSRLTFVGEIWLKAKTMKRD